jgi:hypothetical protein
VQIARRVLSESPWLQQLLESARNVIGFAGLSDLQFIGPVWTYQSGRCVVYRLRAFAFFLVLLVVGAPPKVASAPTPVITFSIHAPAQKDSPLHIVGLQYDKISVRFTLTNDSDRSIVNATIIAVSIAPPACPSDPNRPYMNTHFLIGPTNVSQVLLGPRQKGVVLPQEHGLVSPILPPTILLHNARHLAASYLHVQVEVEEVDFADGTKWTRHDEPPYLHPPFDSSLVDNDAASCLDAAQGLSIPDDVIFGGRVEMLSHGEVSEGSEGSVPRLLFSCSLDGPKVVCPL